MDAFLRSFSAKKRARPLPIFIAFFFVAFLFVLNVSCTTGHLVERVEVEDAGVDAGILTPVLPFRSLLAMTFNVQRFFDPICDTGRCSRGAYEALPSDAQFLAKAQQVAQGIEAVSPDLVFLQEVENQNGLDAVQNALSEPYNVAVIGEQGTPASVDVVVLARGMLLDVVRHQQDEIPLESGGFTTFAREFLEVHLDIQGSYVIAFAAHFKSKANDNPERRLAEAQAAHCIIRGVASQNPGAILILGGDLNDTPFSAPLAELTSDGVLNRIASELGDGAATYFYRSPRAIDHLFHVTTASGSFVDGTANVIGFPAGYSGSDHAVLTGIFSLPPLANDATEGGMP